jgi:hypothetical protein
VARDAGAGTADDILLSADGRTAKVADIGAAAMMDIKHVSQHFGTLAWAALQPLSADRICQLDEEVCHCELVGVARSHSVQT